MSKGYKRGLLQMDLIQDFLKIKISSKAKRKIKLHRVFERKLFDLIIIQLMSII